MKGKNLKLFFMPIVFTISLVSTVYMSQSGQASNVNLTSVKIAMADEEGGGPVTCNSPIACELHKNTKYNSNNQIESCCGKDDYYTTGCKGN